MALFGEKIAETIEFCDNFITIELRSEKSGGFICKDVWDVLLSLGFEYDASLNQFHQPDMPFINVSTFIFPGFDPTLLSHQIPSLLFNLFVPHCVNPTKALFSIHKASIYAQQRLGGILIDGMSQQPLNSESLKSLIEGVKKMEEKLGEIGVKSASFQAFCLFS